MGVLIQVPDMGTTQLGHKKVGIVYFFFVRLIENVSDGNEIPGSRTVKDAKKFITRVCKGCMYKNSQVTIDCFFFWRRSSREVNRINS